MSSQAASVTAVISSTEASYGSCQFIECCCCCCSLQARPHASRDLPVDVFERCPNAAEENGAALLIRGHAELHVEELPQMAQCVNGIRCERPKPHLCPKSARADRQIDRQVGCQHLCCL